MSTNMVGIEGCSYETYSIQGRRSWGGEFIPGSWQITDLGSLSSPSRKLDFGHSNGSRCAIVIAIIRIVLQNHFQPSNIVSQWDIRGLLTLALEIPGTILRSVPIAEPF
jgi:hypothetical protein